MNPADLVLLAQVFNSTEGVPGPPDYMNRRDLNQDGYINPGDLVLLSQMFNMLCT